MSNVDPSSLVDVMETAIMSRIKIKKTRQTDGSNHGYLQHKYLQENYSTDFAKSVVMQVQEYTFDEFIELLCIDLERKFYQGYCHYNC